MKSKHNKPARRKSASSSNRTRLSEKKAIATTNIKTLTDSLNKSYDALVNGQLQHDRAQAISNMAGKIISSAKINLEYNRYMKLKRKVKFLDVK